MAKKNLKKETKRNKADAMTMAMAVPIDSCGSVDCPNPPAFAIGALRRCADCVERVRADYPDSFNRYWAPKMRAL